jgi:hypothetical protein
MLQKAWNLDSFSGKRFPTESRYENLDWQGFPQIRIIENMYLKGNDWMELP